MGARLKCNKRVNIYGSPSPREELFLNINQFSSTSFPKLRSTKFKLLKETKNPLNT